MCNGASAQFASLFNGFVILAAVLAKKGLLDQQDLEMLHSSMTKPLDLPEHSGNEQLEVYRTHIDDVLSTLSSAIESR
ncbi:MAG: hypothetical protein QM681_16760 [Novosphingobium sp.]